MWISPMRKLFAAVVAVAVLAVGATAQAQNSPAAQRVLDKARAASGGAAGWNTLRGVHEVGEEGGKPIERWADPLRFGLRQETQTEGGSKLIQGYNGAAEWRILSSGAATGSDRGPYVAKVRSEAFFSAYGYFYPSRFDLRSSHEGVRQHQGRSYEVLRVQPAGGAPRDMWFDARTGMLARMIEHDGQGAPETIEVSDYRRVGSVMVPFRIVTSGGDMAAPRERVLKRVDFLPADRTMFSLPPPAPPKAAPLAPPVATPAPPPAEKPKRGWRRWLGS
ncbi:hypothetical protein ASE17_16095 [Phenylobacterium sp. Root77]|nr:hypothetical protein ASC73_09975 [Phenylobacterium sp. Root1277]KQW91165.1 hypothetical protein ASC79_17615 [Phenylobacterium sp. Root1290]KRC39199.1 hypothetical protein ASE17_16095 [Phenylobacterium sp. Root77]